MRYAQRCGVILYRTDNRAEETGIVNVLRISKRGLSLVLLMRCFVAFRL